MVWMYGNFSRKKRESPIIIARRQETQVRQTVPIVASPGRPAGMAGGRSAAARPENRGPVPDESTRSGSIVQDRSTGANSSTKGLDSTVADSVAGEVRKISVLPDRWTRTLGLLGRPTSARGSWRISMQTIGVLLLAAATAGDGFGYSQPGRRPEKVAAPARGRLNGHMPPAARQYTAASMAGRAAGGHGAPRPTVRQHPEPDLLPRPRRHEDRLADRRRPQWRADLPARPAHRAGTL